ncbi:MAG TPA: hybrid sensor histidine kinase/response regulator [Deltaproteobacteria bacterium]|nr:hybrid sensor histidine kinase/response regulator [Deltaproteobacteria bacterium]
MIDSKGKSPGRNGKLRVLIVEDSRYFYTLLEGLLRDIDARRFAVDWADSYADALKAMESRRYDVFLVDLFLGDSSGLELIREARKREIQTPSILITAEGGRDADVEAMRAGAFDYLDKEKIDAALLERTIRYAMEHARTLEKLREREEEIRLLLNSTAEAIVGVDLEGRCTFCNPSCTKLLGYGGEEELLGADVFDMIEVPGGDGESPFRVLRGGEGVHFDDGVVRRADGSVFPAECWAHPVRKNGVVIGGVVTFLDITERKRAEQEKDAMRAQLLHAQKMDAVGTLAGGVAHDFNNLLTTIHGVAELMRARIGDGDPACQDLDTILKAARRAASLTKQLLIFSRKQPIEFAPVDLNGIVDDMLKMLGRLIGEDIAVETDLEPELWAVSADSGNMEQVIMNLAVNARDAMPEGGSIRIRTCNVKLDAASSRAIPYSRPGAFVCLRVEDTGRGMERSLLPRIFEPYFTTKEVGRGAGLGLSVVYGIVKRHNGWINVESEPGRGSLFSIYLPASFEQVEDTTAQEVSLRDLKGGGERVLLVEDEGDVRRFAGRALRENGYVVFDAATAGEAAELFEREDGEFHLVFSDVVLTDRNGIQLVGQLRAVRPGLPVLLCSGYTDHKSQWKSIEEKGYPFLSKPYTLEELLTKVKTAIRDPR